MKVRKQKNLERKPAQNVMRTYVYTTHKLNSKAVVKPSQKVLYYKTF